jgi:predicted MFS family arabinose efflux permease
MEQTNETLTIHGVKPAAALPQSLVWIMAIAAGLTVANLYYLQPLLATIGHEFGVAASAAGFVATLGQVGYALGLLLIVPLGDIRERRGLIIATLVAVTVALLATAAAPSLGWLAAGSLVVGATTVTPQLIIPFAATLASPEQRGRVVGTVMSGLLIGILLARTVSGIIGAHFGWRTMFVLAGAMMVALTLILWWVLPVSRPTTALSYPQLLRSLPGLLRREPVLWETCALGALAFASFSVFWVTLAFFLETPPYHYGSEVAGLFGLVGVAGALAAALVGRVADRRDPRLVTGLTLLIILAAYAIFWLAGWSLLGLTAGVILLDLGVQGTQVSNQTRIYALAPDARSRINTIYMTTYFVGGALGSLLGAYSWSTWGWSGVCAAGGLLMLAGLAIYARPRKLA